MGYSKCGKDAIVPIRQRGKSFALIWFYHVSFLPIGYFLKEAERSMPSKGIKLIYDFSKEHTKWISYIGRYFFILYFIHYLDTFYEDIWKLTISNYINCAIRIAIDLGILFILNGSINIFRVFIEKWSLGR